YKSFPKGNIYIIGVDAELTPENRHIADLLNDHSFIGADNGIISILTEECTADRIVEINIHGIVESMFTVLDVIVTVACHIASGGTLEVIVSTIDDIKPVKNLIPIINNTETQIS